MVEISIPVELIFRLIFSGSMLILLYPSLAYGMVR